MSLGLREQKSCDSCAAGILPRTVLANHSLWLPFPQIQPERRLCEDEAHSGFCWPGVETLMEEQKGPFVHAGGFVLEPRYAIESMPHAPRQRGSCISLCKCRWRGVKHHCALALSNIMQH